MRSDLQLTLPRPARRPMDGSANLLGTQWARVRAMRLLIPAAAHDDAWPPPCRAREADAAHLAVANGPAATAAAWVRLV
jgi:hypothetical protein